MGPVKSIWEDWALWECPGTSRVADPILSWFSSKNISCLLSPPSVSQQCCVQLLHCLPSLLLQKIKVPSNIVLDTLHSITFSPHAYTKASNRMGSILSLRSWYLILWVLPDAPSGTRRGGGGGTTLLQLCFTISFKIGMARVVHSAKRDPHGQTADEHKDIKVGKHTMCHALLHFHNKPSTTVALVWMKKTREYNQRSKRGKRACAMEGE